MNRRSSVISIFAPVFVIYLVSNMLTFTITQLSMAGLVLAYGPLSYSELMGKLLKFFSSKDFVLLNTVVSGICCAVIFSVWYIRMLKDDSKEESNAKMAPYKAGNSIIIAGAILVAVACQFLGEFLIEIFAKIFPAWVVLYKESLESIGLSMTGGNLDAPILLIAYTVIFAPIMEELAFRGIALKNALKGLPATAAIVMTSLLFSMIHGSYLQMAYTFLFAMILAYIYTKTERIYICILIHILFNGISMFIPKYINIGNSPIFSFIILLTSMAALYVGIIMITKPLINTDGGNYER